MHFVCFHFIQCLFVKTRTTWGQKERERGKNDNILWIFSYNYIIIWWCFSHSAVRLWLFVVPILIALVQAIPYWMHFNVATHCSLPFFPSVSAVSLSSSLLYIVYRRLNLIVYISCSEPSVWRVCFPYATIATYRDDVLSLRFTFALPLFSLLSLSSALVCLLRIYILYILVGHYWTI